MKNTPLWLSLTAEEREALKAEGVVKIGNGRPEEELFGAFDWKCSKAGHAYWEGVYRRLSLCAYSRLKDKGFWSRGSKFPETLFKGGVVVVFGEDTTIRVNGATITCRGDVQEVGDDDSVKMKLSGEVEITFES